MKAIKSFKLAMASAICLTAISACQQEKDPVTPDKPDMPEMDVIKAVVNNIDQSTKSYALPCEELTQSIPMTEEGLVLQEYVCDNLTQPVIGESTDTKGTLVTTANITEFGEFGMEGFLDNYNDIIPEEKTKFNVVLTDTDQYVVGGTAKYSGDWDLLNSKGEFYPWLHGIHYTFWAYFPKTKLGTYSYGSAGSRGAMKIEGYDTPSKAADQKDLLIAYKKHYAPGISEPVSINFRHALADILFDVTAITENGYKVEGIEIAGAYSKGECSITGADLSDTDVTKAFVWTLDKTSAATFTMAGGADHFFMIPQALLEGASLKITLSKDGVTFSPSTLAMKTTWLAGKFYKYKLTYTEKLDIEVEESCSDDVKTDVSVKNVGNCPVYIRAAVVANWFNADGDIVAAWDMAQGTFEGFPGTDWEAGDDGFYYYKKVVQAGENTESLFDKYTKPTPPATGMRLEMKVMAQGIKYVTSETYKSAWPY